MWDEITYSISKFNGRIVDKWISDFTPHFIIDVITGITVNPCQLTDFHEYGVQLHFAVLTDKQYEKQT